MYGRGGASSLDLGGLGCGGVADSRITVYGFCSNCGAICDKLAPPQTEKDKANNKQQVAKWVAAKFRAVDNPAK